MARRKRNSEVLERADRRIESLRSISAELDFGSGLTLKAYTSTIDSLRSKLAAYNTALSSIDKLADDVSSAEQLVMAMSEKMLLGVGSRYGKTSQEYEMAGGSRRKVNRRTSSASPSTPSTTSSVPTASTNGSTNGTSPATVS
ncbi:hypothetical protein H6F76_07315 [Leptolyngbya sp. FACHB-321]|uniref:hypothetical protein n=1 Tax=Leptolyngbya sp. FACHB-321 TaxID=2692807 RepID=UPI001687BD56|nr:hypothetical protein [Leptolyngbya sp. FACHB-321]MBD2034842.1 hypothetical protein [Leptolyngbya sp. FACHB-321]